MKQSKNNPTEGVTNQTSVNVREGFNPISTQIKIINKLQEVCKNLERDIDFDKVMDDLLPQNEPDTLTQLYSSVVKNAVELIYESKDQDEWLGEFDFYDEIKEMILSYLMSEIKWELDPFVEQLNQN